MPEKEELPKGDLLEYPTLNGCLEFLCKKRNKITPKELLYIDIDCGKCHDIRIYYYNDEVIYGMKLDRPGFHFIVVEVVTYDPQQNIWGDSTEIKVLCHGEARFDGIRHLWFGNPTEDGYLYYQSPYLMKLIMEELMILEDKFCDPTQIHR